jgi:hypothetical protein
MLGHHAPYNHILIFVPLPSTFYSRFRPTDFAPDFAPPGLNVLGVDFARISLDLRPDWFTQVGQVVGARCHCVGCVAAAGVRPRLLGGFD